MIPALSPGMRQYYAQNPDDNPFGQTQAGMSGSPQLATTSQYRSPQGMSAGSGMSLGAAGSVGADLPGLAYAQARTLRRPRYYQSAPTTASLSGWLGR